MALIKGQKYSKKGVGFKKPEYSGATAIINGEIYFFITLSGKYNNEWKNGRLIVDTSCSSHVVQHNTTPNKTVHVFVRNFPISPFFEYIGDLDYMKPYDPNRNDWVLK